MRYFPFRHFPSVFGRSNLIWDTLLDFDRIRLLNHPKCLGNVFRHMSLLGSFCQWWYEERNLSCFYRIIIKNNADFFFTCSINWSRKPGYLREVGAFCNGLCKFETGFDVSISHTNYFPPHTDIYYVW